ncbi:hypothetical protein [Christiangramia sediminis]|uniref:Uncharacterized protein n=1 Tax=Christiangramia sediminis TaxID=2881336 RepID=A0A9X1LJW2_9FLAO|nr:hypothetical protein [Christiangramia sediminis]MCB7481682.1 hypothetical protein [Christiangramia sediminis]
MRNFFNTIMVGLLLMGCSVDNDETIVNDNQLLIANSVLEVDGCESVNYELLNSTNSIVGNFVVTNDEDNLYLNFSAPSGFLITEIIWQVASNENELPINNGGIIVGQLNNKKKFSSGTNYYGETIALDNYNEDIHELAVVAKVELTNESLQKFSVWVGDVIIGRKGSKLLYYTICEPQYEPVCEAYAGDNNSITYTRREIDDIVDTEEDLENVYKNLLEEGVSREGSFEPTIHEIVLSYYFDSKYQDFKTVYTVTNEINGETCSDSVELTLTVTR